MAKGVRFSEAALRWIEQEAERIAENFGPSSAQDFKRRIEAAVRNVSDFPNMAKRGRIPGSRIITVFRRTVLTIVERDGGLVVAAARSHWQADAYEPHEARLGSDMEPSDEADTEGGPEV